MENLRSRSRSSIAKFSKIEIEIIDRGAAIERQVCLQGTVLQSRVRTELRSFDLSDLEVWLDLFRSMKTANERRTNFEHP